MAKDGTNRGRKKGSLGWRARTLIEIHEGLEAQGLTDPRKVELKLYELAVAGDTAAMKEYHDRRFGAVPRSDVLTVRREMTPDEADEIIRAAGLELEESSPTPPAPEGPAN